MTDEIMLPQRRLVQVRFVAIIEDALKLLPGDLRLVGLLVLLEIAAGCKFLAAIVARERLLTRVDTLMTDQVRDL